MMKVTVAVGVFCLVFLPAVMADGTDLDILDCMSVQFYLVTRDFSEGKGIKACLEQKTPLFDNHLDVTKPTKVLVHGWTNDVNSEFTTTIAQTYLSVSDVNVIKVDWGVDAETDYLTAATRMPQVAKTLAALIVRLRDENGLKLDDLHLVGHSLGAHVVGVAGYQFTTSKIGQVTGLDPASVLFYTASNDGRISTESGEFVTILHTCGGLLGLPYELGHVDFYPNGGLPGQPGCLSVDGLLSSCSHSRAISLFSESLYNPTGFKGTECSLYLWYLLGFCNSNPTAYLGENVDRSASGKYYFKTASSPPYALG